MSVTLLTQIPHPTPAQTFFHFARSHATQSGSPLRAVTVHRAPRQEKRRTGTATATSGRRASASPRGDSQSAASHAVGIGSQPGSSLVTSPPTNVHTEVASTGSPMPGVDHSKKTLMDQKSAQHRRKVMVLPPLPVAGRVDVPTAAADTVAVGTVLVLQQGQEESACDAAIAEDATPENLAQRSARSAPMRARFGLLFELVGVGLMMGILMAFAALS